MFLVFGLSITLAAFGVVNAVTSLAVALAAPRVLRRLSEGRLRRRASVLLGLRLLPAIAASVAAAGLVLPAYVALEPADAGERVTLRLGLAAGAALAILLAGLWRGLRALGATARLARRWEDGAERVELGGCGLPVCRVREDRAVFSVLGWRRPRLFVSARVLDLLTPEEIGAAVAHERAHVGARDNVKRLLMRFAPDLMASTSAARRIEDEWVATAEAMADHRASAGDRRTALALAAALIKVARLAPADAGLPVSALHDGGDVTARVRLLMRAEAEREGDPGAPAGRRAVLAATAALAAGTAVAISALPAVHGLIEVAARLLR